MTDAADEPPAEERLDSWKEIAAYLKRDVSTVQRWEKRERMPIRRHLHDKLGSVYAYRSELDAWARSRHPEPEAESAPPGSAPVLHAQTWQRPRVIWPAAALALLAAAAVWQIVRNTEEAWRNPLEDARLANVTDFDGVEQAAAISRDGRFVAFLSDHEGRMDVWVTQVGTGQFYNLTRGRVRELVNPSIRTLGFSPDGSLVTFWARGAAQSGGTDISVWAVPTLGGEPRVYLEGAAEFDWSQDGSRLLYHTPGPGDPLFVRDPREPNRDRRIFAAAEGVHGHFPFWSPNLEFIYLVQGRVPDDMDVWRIRSSGGAPERITEHRSLVSFPVLIDDRTLMYLAADADGSGPWLYALDVGRAVPHRVRSGFDRFTSLSSSADGHRIVATLANRYATLWRMPIDGTGASALHQVALPTARGSSPRFGPGGLLFVGSKDAGDGIWKFADGVATELWSAPGARVIGGPQIAPDQRRVAFSVERLGRREMYVMNADGTDARVVTASLDLQGNPAWSPDGRAITSAANVDRTPRLFTIPLEGAPAPLVREYSIEPVWAPGGEFLVYSGPDVGTAVPMKAVNAAGQRYPMPDLTLTRGARHVRFFPGRHALVVMRGDIQHKDLWLVDLQTKAEQQLTRLPPDFNIRDFDISGDGRELVLERVQERSDIVLIDLAPRR